MSQDPESASEPETVPEATDAGTRPSEDDGSPTGNRGAIGRREFLRRGGTGAGSLALAGSLPGLLSSCASAPAAGTGGGSPDVVVVGAGAFGGWTALNLVEMGARVTLVDLYGPGNSRATSGDETRGVRTGYPGRDLWTRWASLAIERWRAFDEEWSPVLGGNVFFNTGDVALREDWSGFLQDTAETWDRNGVEYERMEPDEVAYRWPNINVEGFGAALYEPDAGIARARAACQWVAEVFQRRGGEVRIARAMPGGSVGDRLSELALEPGGALAADRFVFALGPWFPKTFPSFMADRLRVSTLGHVYYWGTPPGDTRFQVPNMPSYNFPGVTGWPAIPPDFRGFRIRTGGHTAEDPDTSVRWIPEEYLEQPLDILRERFPALADQPLVETRSCHYESSVTREWIIDRHPDYRNVWIAGGGSAEGFKFGPMLGELIAGRVLERGTHPELDDQFRIRAEDTA